MKETSYPWFRSWLVWLDDWLNQPGKQEYYMMRIALEVARANAKDPNSVNLDQFKIRFERQRVAQTPFRRLTAEDVAKIQKARWQWAFGRKRGRR